MENKLSRHGSGRWFFGLVLVVLGALFLMNNFGYIYVDHIGRYWPALFIIFGFVKLTESDFKSHHANGIGWIFLGTWMLVSMNEIFGLDFHNSWPILIIGWGVSLLWRAFYRQPQITIAEEQNHGN